jgi:hypothetical protein
MFLSIQTMEILNSQTTYYISNSLTHQEIQNPKFNSVCLNCCLKLLIKVRNHINFYLIKNIKHFFYFIISLDNEDELIKNSLIVGFSQLNINKILL